MSNDKKNGIQLNFDTITNEQLLSLWHKECYPDSMVADLYDVTQSQVRKKRYSWNMKKFECIINDLITELNLEYKL